METRREAITRAKRAPNKVLAAIYTDIFRRAVPKVFFDALPDALSVDDAMKPFPAFNEKHPFADPHWVFLRDRLEANYLKVIEKIAAQESRLRGFVTKIDQPHMFPQTLAEYLRRMGTQRIVEISAETRDRVRFIVGENMNSLGRVAKDARAQIVASTGLTRAELERIQALDISEGAKRARVKVAKKRRSLVIGRTEANAVRNQGLLKSWVDAKDQGQIKPTALKEWVAFTDERLSEICEDLNTDRVPINATFDGGFFGPPAHPNCRSTMVLVEA